MYLKFLFYPNKLKKECNIWVMLFFLFVFNFTQRDHKHKPGTLVMTKEEKRVTTLHHAWLRSIIFILRKICEQELKYT